MLIQTGGVRLKIGGNLNYTPCLQDCILQHSRSSWWTFSLEIPGFRNWLLCCCLPFLSFCSKTIFSLAFGLLVEAVLVSCCFVFLCPIGFLGFFLAEFYALNEIPVLFFSANYHDSNISVQDINLQTEIKQNV